MLSRHFVVLVSGALLLATAGCREELTAVPGELIGVWETPADGYQGRFLEIRPGVLRFGSAADESVSYTVVGAVREEAEFGFAWAIVYQDADYPATDSDQSRLHLVYDASVKALRLKHRSQITWWKRGSEQLRSVTESR